MQPAGWCVMMLKYIFFPARRGKLVKGDGKMEGAKRRPNCGKQKFEEANDLGFVKITWGHTITVMPKILVQQ